MTYNKFLKWMLATRYGAVGWIVLLSTVISFPILSSADNASLYAGLGYGTANFEGPRIEGALSELAPGQRLKDDAGFAELYFGYRFNRFISLEIGYADFGEVSKTYALNPDLAFIVSPNDTEVIDSNSFSFGALMEYPLPNKYSVFAVLGYLKFDLDRELSGGFSPDSGGLRESTSDSEESVFYGLGAKYAFNQKYAVRLQWLDADPGDFQLQTTRFSLEVTF